MKRIALALVFPALMLGCSDDKSGKPKPKGDLIEAGTPASNVLLVTDENGAPLAGAKVLIGHALDHPFAGNFLTADGKGQITIPAAWTEELPVTVDVPGFVRVTRFARRPQGATFLLRRQNQEPRFELKGRTNGHPVKDYDGQADFGLVMAALTRTDVMAFDINKVISAQVDIMSVMGQKLELPSNVAIPRQKENYILPLTLEKPVYRLYFSEKKTQKVFAAKGRFPFRTVVDRIRAGDKFYNLLNHFEIGGGVVRDVALAGNSTSLDLPVGELTFSQKKNFRAPAVRADEVLVVLAAADMKGFMVPTDIKKLDANQTLALSTLATSPALAIGVLKRASEFDEGSGVDRLSAVILPFGNGVAPQFLPLIDDPRFGRDESELVLPRPSSLPGVNELATVSRLSEVKEIAMGKGKLPFLVGRWDVSAPAWVDRMDLPEWPGSSMPQSDKMRWELTYLGSQLKEEADLGQAVIDAATHITHSSLDF